MTVVESYLAARADCSCGAGMRWHADPDADVYWWADEFGRTSTEAAPDGRHPTEILLELRGLAPSDPWAAAEYSKLECALTLGHNPYRHVHDRRPPAFEGRCPECCGAPMQLRPSGWTCRVVRSHRVSRGGPTGGDLVVISGGPTSPDPAD